MIWMLLVLAVVCVLDLGPCFVFGWGRLCKALVELEAAGMLPSSHDEAARLAARIRLRGPRDVVTGVLAHVSAHSVVVIVDG